MTDHSEHSDHDHGSADTHAHHAGCCCPTSEPDILASQAENQYNLGHFWLNKERPEIAAGFFELALKLLDIAGAGATSTRVWSVCGLADIAFKKGDIPSTISLSKQAHSLAVQGLGANHPGTAINACNLGEIFVEIGRTAEGVTLLEDGLAALRQPTVVDERYSAEFLASAIAGFEPVLQKGYAALTAATLETAATQG